MGQLQTITIKPAMLNSYKILTITHRTTSIDKIGNFVVKYDTPELLQAHLLDIKREFQLEELMYLSTCNRVMYFFRSNAPVDPQFQYRFFRKINQNLDAHRIEKSVKVYEGDKALDHFCSVAASTDSMVVGEREILRQLRTAYEQSKDWGLTGDDLRIAMNLAIQASKDVYSNTRIGEKPISIASLAALRLRNSTLSKGARILLIGAGQTNMLIAKFLKKYEYSNVIVFNRTLAKAKKLAKMLGGQAQLLSKLKDYREGFDGIIVCTGSTKPIITRALYENLLIGSKAKKLVIDLSIPNNVDKRMLSDFDVEYVEVETLRTLAKENLAFRHAEVHKAKQILQRHLDEFPMIYQQRKIARAMKTVPDAIKEVKSHALNNVFKHEVDSLDAETRELLERMLTYMEKKCIGIPMKAAKEAILD
ncbi:MAG: glutamyl-tRNA reductase [Bacteroidota bacterium]